MKKTLAILLSLALVICMIPGAAFAAEGTGGQPAAKTAISSVALSSTNALYGHSALPTLTVKAAGSDTALTAGTDYTVVWSPAAPSAESTVGTYTATVTGTGNYEGTLTAAYAIAPIDLARATITLKTDLTSANLKTDGTTNLVTAGLVAVMQDGVDITSQCTLSYKVVNNAAYITAKATGDASGNVLTSSKESAFTIKTVLTANLIQDIAAQAYTGSAVKPTVSVKHPSSYGYLREGYDYTVSYANNINATSAAQAIVTPIGNYTNGGTALTKNFVITQRSLSDYAVKVTVPDAIYNGGSAVELNETVYYGDTLLRRGVDYQISTSSNAVGLSTVYITGYGNYKDVVSRNIYIVEADKALTASNTYIYVGGKSGNSYSVTYNGYPQTPNVSVFKGETSSSATALSPNYYNVTYSNNDVAGTATITITGKNGYAGTVTATFRIDAAKMDQYNTTISGVSSTYTYTGTPIAPEVVVRVNGVTLTKGKHYTVTYLNNKNISSSYSKARVSVTAIAGSGYTGTVTQEFTILGKSMAGYSASFTNGVSSSQYNGLTVTPSIIVRDGYYTVLRQGTDYTVSYKDAAGKAVASMRDAGTYTVVITGKGNYSGELTLSYTITGKDISYYTVALNKYSAEATGTAQRPTVSSVKYGSTALKTTDYTVTYQNSLGQTVTSMTAPGTYKVVVTGKGGYSGSTSATFTITGNPQTVTLNKGNVKVYKDTDPFKVTAKATGDGTGFIYTSSNPEVATVNASGVVTIKSIGRAKITATTVGMKKSEEASASFVVKVYPDKATLSKKPWTEGKKGSLRVRWDKQDDVTYYEVRYSRDKSFKKGSYLTKKVNASTLNYTTQSTSIKNLKSGYKYYVKVRAVKVVYNDYGQELKYYGKWSNWKSCVTK